MNRKQLNENQSKSKVASNLNIIESYSKICFRVLNVNLNRFVDLNVLLPHVGLSAIVWFADFGSTLNSKFHEVFDFCRLLAGVPKEKPSC